MMRDSYLRSPGLGAWGQSNKDFYTSGQIYKRILKHENNALT